jgi:hypothetical protein
MEGVGKRLLLLLDGALLFLQIGLRGRPTGLSTDSDLWRDDPPITELPNLTHELLGLDERNALIEARDLGHVRVKSRLLTVSIEAPLRNGGELSFAFNPMRAYYQMNAAGELAPPDRNPRQAAIGDIGQSLQRRLSDG